MKLIETILDPKNRPAIMMFLCLAYGGFSLILFISQIYGFFWRSEFMDPQFFDVIFREARRIDGNWIDGNIPDENFGPRRVLVQPNIFGVLSSPFSLSSLIGGIISILAGITIWRLMREKEVKAAKEATATQLLLPDEKSVMKVLRDSNGESTQAKITRESGLSKVQTHRALKRLEAKGVIEKHDYGLTNKVILKKGFLD